MSIAKRLAAGARARERQTPISDHVRSMSPIEAAPARPAAPAGPPARPPAAAAHVALLARGPVAGLFWIVEPCRLPVAVRVDVGRPFRIEAGRLRPEGMPGAGFTPESLVMCAQKSIHGFTILT
jgi:hypothetical protein